MSLLLDALKKAAEDKQKSSSPDEKNDTQSSVDNHQDMELSFDDFELPVDEIQKTDTTDDDSPLIIDDADKPQYVEHEDMQDLPELRDDLPAATEPMAAEKETDTFHEDINSKHAGETDNDKEIVASSEQHTEIVSAELNDEKQTRVPPRDTSPPPQQARPEKRIKPEPAVSSREALDMMIHKSRHAAERRNARVRNIGLLVFILLLCLGGSYFYFDSQQKIATLQQSNSQLSQQLNDIDSNVNEPVPRPAVISRPVVTPVKEVQASSQPASTNRSPVQAPKKPVAKAPAKSIQISVRSVEDPVDVLLSRAYQKFIAGDYDTANGLYMQVLDREEKNRDALLGTAAVAMKQQRYEYARQKYQSLLVLDPKDSLARAGMSAIDSDANSESRLKFMLREQPEAAHLYFALGSLYAAQQRWPEAQQAFFSAWSGDANNPDYAYNLAICLDQLGKYKQAKNIYQTTLNLAEGHQVEFSTGDVQARIEQLGKLAHE